MTDSLTPEIGERVFPATPDQPLGVAVQHVSTTSEKNGQYETVVHQLYRLRFSSGFVLNVNVPGKASFIPRYFVLSSCCDSSLTRSIDDNAARCQVCGTKLGNEAPSYPMLGPTRSATLGILDRFTLWVKYWYGVNVGPLEAELDASAVEQTLWAITSDPASYLKSAD